MRSRVVVAMSGGVDSSVAAAMLVEAGHDVLGVFMRHGSPAAVGSLPVLDATPRPGHQGCCSVEDALDAKRVADRLGIPLYPLELSADFHRIIDYFADEYGRGRTPNPCVRCNTWLKFGRLFDYADAVGASHVATGHHARLLHEPDGDSRLARGRDRGKDQSYVLFEVPRARLGRMLLPVGDRTKEEVRARAADLGLATADKPDSQEICFVAPGQHPALVGRILGGSRAGPVVSTRGEVLGEHQGIEHFTVGQRHGTGIATGERLYVVRIEAEGCRVVVGPRSEVPQQQLTAGHASWLVEEPTGELECFVQCRSSQPPAPAVVTPLPGGRFDVRFSGQAESLPTDAAPWPGALSPGQAAVVYAGDRVLGGGWIEHSRADSPQSA
jgi:tRNA-specific 2-thiouridylase